MQRTEQKTSGNQQELSRNNSLTFSKMRNRITHNNQHENEILRQIGQITQKKIENKPKEERHFQQTPKLMQNKRQFTNSTTRLKLKDYIRLTEISRQKRSQSASSNQLRSKRAIKEEKNLNLRVTFATETDSNRVQQQKTIHKKPSRPYEKQIELEKEHLLLTSQKAREKLNIILNLIDEFKEKLSGIEEILNNQILNGLSKIEKALDEHFVDNYEHNIKSIKNKIQSTHFSRQKQTQHMSPALRAQFKALQEIYLIDKKPNIPISKWHSMTEFNQNQSQSIILNQANPQIVRRLKS